MLSSWIDELNKFLWTFEKWFLLYLLSLIPWVQLKFLAHQMY